jgi:hypothetical protein
VGARPLPPRPHPRDRSLRPESPASSPGSSISTSTAPRRRTGCAMPPTRRASAPARSAGTSPRTPAARTASATA